jgi:hypothetical protein
MLFTNRLEFSCFADFFVRILKTSEEYVCLFFKAASRKTVNSMEQRLESSFNRCPRIPSQGCERVEFERKVKAWVWRRGKRKGEGGANGKCWRYFKLLSFHIDMGLEVVHSVPAGLHL